MNAHGEHNGGSVNPHALAPRGGSDLANAPMFGDFGLGPVMGEPAPSGPTIGGYLSMIIRHKWLALAVFVLIAGSTIPVIWYFMIPKYRANAVVRVSPMVPRVIYKYEENGILPLYKSFLSTQVAIIRSPNVLQRVIELSAVKNTDWFKDKSKNIMGRSPNPLERLTEALSVGERRGTELIDVVMETEKADDAKVVADAVVDQYIQIVREREQSEESERMKLLVKKSTELQGQIDAQINRRNNIATDLGTDNPVQYRDQLMTQLSELRSDLDRHTRERRALEWKLERLNAAEEQSEPADGAEPTTEEVDVRFSDDAEWRQLHRSVEDIKHRLSKLREQYGEMHPSVKHTVADVEHAEMLLATRETELMDRTAVNPAVVPGGIGQTPASPIVTRQAIESFIEDFRFRESELKQSIEAQLRKTKDVSKLANTLTEIDQDLSNLRNEQSLVLDRIKVLQVESGVGGQIEISSHALRPSDPHRDRRLLLSVMALFGAMGAGLGAALLRGMLDPSVRQAEDVTWAVQAPFLGFLPKVRFETDLWEETPESLQENMRMIRTALLERLPRKGGSSVLVTSSGAQAGKTSVAILLAKSLAQIGKRVLLIDADLRRPSLTGRLKLNAGAGLSEVLAGSAAADSVVIQNRFVGVDVIPTSPDSPNHDPELIANGLFAANLETWKNRYDFVIIDSPPILPVADARIMASHVDGAILTLRASHCRKADAVGAAALLAASGCQPLGTILVAADQSLSYGGRYGGPYSYTPQLVGSA